MEKLIASLLCCSVDSEEREAAHVPSLKPVQSNHHTTKTHAQQSNNTNVKKQQKQHVKPTENEVIDTKRNSSEIDNSTNGSDTITTNNPEIQPNTHQVTVPIATHKDIITQVDENQGCHSLTFSHDDIDLTAIQDGQVVSSSGWLLNVKEPKYKGKKCLVLDLDETLVHSSFKYLRAADFVIPVEIENQVHNVYVIKRPGVDEFIEKVGQWYEVVVFTASVSRYGDPLLNKLDKLHNIHHRLFRESCYNYQGNYIKNLSQIGRPLSDLIIIDNSPASYIFHPQHSIPISSWFSDSHDNELLDLLPFLKDLSEQNVDDVSLVLDVTI